MNVNYHIEVFSPDDRYDVLEDYHNLLLHFHFHLYGVWRCIANNYKRLFRILQPASYFVFLFCPSGIDSNILV